MKDYIICIPSYKRAQVCNDKTLSTLNKNKIPASKIYVYVANQEEYDLYKKTLDPKLYHQLIQFVLLYYQYIFEMFEMMNIVPPLD